MREVTLHVEAGDEDLRDALATFCRRVQVTQARVNGEGINFEDLPNPPGSPYGEPEDEVDVPDWPLKTAPDVYLQSNPDGKHAELARQIVAAVG